MVRLGMTAVILAAGKGVRMRSSLPKVMHPVLGRPMVQYVIDTVRSIGADKVDLIVGYGRERLTEILAGQDLGFVVQDQQLGTGHAIQCWAKAAATPPDTVLVVCGDTPLLSAATLKEMLAVHRAQQPAATMMTLMMQDPGSYGRVLRDGADRVTAIREAKDCAPEQLQVREVNLAVYLFSGAALFEHLPRLTNNNRQNEYYLTDIIELMVGAGQTVLAVKEHDERSTLGINSRADLARVAALVGEATRLRHLDAGVGMDDPSQVYIEPTVEIGADTHLLPGVVLAGTTRIGSHCVIGPHVEIRNAVVEDGVIARHACIENTTVRTGSRIGPFVHMSDEAGKRRD